MCRLHEYERDTLGESGLRVMNAIDAVDPNDNPT
jgi:hypothetical protein